MQDENRSKIIVTTKINPAGFFYLAFLFLVLLFVADYNSIVKSISVCLFAMVIALCVDRFRKHILISSFEDDLQILKRKIK